MNFGNHGKLSSNTTIGTVKEQGVSVFHAETKNGYKGVILHIDEDNEFLALCAEEFDGKINDDTIIIKGKNAKLEPRLYLSNKEGGIIQRGDEL